MIFKDRNVTTELQNKRISHAVMLRLLKVSSSTAGVEHGRVFLVMSFRIVLVFVNVERRWCLAHPIPRR